MSEHHCTEFEIENSDSALVKRRKMIRVVHKPRANYGYQFYGEILTPVLSGRSTAQ